MNVKYYYTPSYIAHHGIKGQRWGIRRFQNLNGSLTRAGKQRYDHQLRYQSKSVSDKVAKAKAMATTVGVRALTMAVPEFYPFIRVALLADFARFMKTYMYYNFDTTNYIKKKDGPLETIKDMKRLSQKESINESSNVKNVNPYYKKKGGYNNCTNCAITVDMRQRGYDVRARRRGTGRTNQEIASMYKDSKIVKPNYGIKQERGESRKEYVSRSYDNFCKAIESEGKNSRGIVTIMYQSGRYDLSSSGHAFNYEVKDGRVSFYDAQSKKADCDRTFSFANPESYTYIRTDNKIPSNDIGEAVISRKDKR